MLTCYSKLIRNIWLYFFIRLLFTPYYRVAEGRFRNRQSSSFAYDAVGEKSAIVWIALKILQSHLLEKTVLADTLYEKTWGNHIHHPD